MGRTEDVHRLSPFVCQIQATFRTLQTDVNRLCSVFEWQKSELMAEDDLADFSYAHHLISSASERTDLASVGRYKPGRTGNAINYNSKQTRRQRLVKFYISTALRFVMVPLATVYISFPIIPQAHVQGVFPFSLLKCFTSKTLRGTLVLLSCCLSFRDVLYQHQKVY